MKTLTKIVLSVLGLGGAVAAGWRYYQKKKTPPKKELGPRHKSPLKCVNDR